MQSSATNSTATSKTKLFVILSAFIILAVASATGKQLLGLLLILLGELPIAASVFLSAAGWGKLCFGKLTAMKSKLLVFSANTACGLWLLSTAMLTTGSFFSFGLSTWLWRGIIAAGIFLLIWQNRFVNFKINSKPENSQALLKTACVIIVSLGCGLWLAGTSLPAGKVGLVTKDFYDVESYHLQIPREYFDNGQITALPHNTYSNFPLGCEMLYLICMCLKNSALNSLYAAKLTSGLWAILAAMAVAGIFEQRKSKATTAAFFVSAPAIIYLSWLAFVELAQCAYMAVAVGYLIHLANNGKFKDKIKAVTVCAIACGAACGCKYLSVGLIVAPIGLAIVFNAGSLNFSSRIKLLFIWLVIVCAAFSPWLVRNIIYTGNPVFPLAGSIFGSGHWSPSQQQMWDSAHSPLSWAEKFSHLPNIALQLRGFGAVLVLLVVIAAIVLLKNKDNQKRNTVRSCTLILLTQILIWMLATHMPVRFLTIALVPVAILAAMFVENLNSRYRLFIISVCCAAGITQSFVALSHERIMLKQMGFDPYAVAGATTAQLQKLYADSDYGRRLNAPDAKILMVGDVRALQMPAGTFYASIWEKSVLENAVEHAQTPQEIPDILKNKYGITDVLVSRIEIARLKATYGWSGKITEEVFTQLKKSSRQIIDVQPDLNIDDKPIVELYVLK